MIPSHRHSVPACELGVCVAGLDAHRRSSCADEGRSSACCSEPSDAAPDDPASGRGTRALGVTVTMDARQGADLVDLLKPPVTVPIHFDDYDRFKSPLGDFVAEVRRRELPGELRTVHRGDTIRLRSTHGGPR